MRKYLIFFIMMCSGVRAFAINGADSLSFEYTVPPKASWVKGLLQLSFSGKVSGHMSGPKAISLIPQYIVATDTINFPAIGFFSRQGARYHKRKLTVGERKEPSIVVRCDSLCSRYDYVQSLPVPALQGGKFLIVAKANKCGANRILSVDTVIVPSKQKGNIQNFPSVRQNNKKLCVTEKNVTFIRPPAEELKRRTANVKLYIMYRVGDWHLDMNIGDNIKELKKMDSYLIPLLDDTLRYTIDEIRVLGYASPEDTWQNNHLLSFNRAKNICSLIERQYFCGRKISIGFEGKGEDWDGLQKMVSEGNMVDREKVLAIIDEWGIFQGRERRLMDLHGGVPYRFMLKNYFPKLRRVEVHITYNVADFNGNDVNVLIKERPWDLSHREMYDFARQVNDNSSTGGNYGKEYDKITAYFPKDDIAYINASSAALIRGDVDLAGTYLSKVLHRPEAYNNIGVYCFLMKNYAMARFYFEKAIEQNSEEAYYNLKKMEDL